MATPFTIKPALSLRRRHLIINCHRSNQLCFSRDANGSTHGLATSRSLDLLECVDIGFLHVGRLQFPEELRLLSWVWCVDLEEFLLSDLAVRFHPVGGTTIRLVMSEDGIAIVEV